MIVGIFHSADLDGITCGALFKIKFPDAVLIPYDYRKPLYQIEQIPDGSTVIMMDVSLPPAAMVKLAKRNTLTWIDHHEKIIKELSGKSAVVNEIVWVDGAAILFVCDPSRAACEITMDFFKIDEEITVGGRLAVQTLAMYDIWKNENLKAWNNEIMPFQFGMRGKVGLDVEKMVKYLTTVSLPQRDRTVADGKMILSYQYEQDQMLIAKAAYDCDLIVNGKKYKAVAINGVGISSDSFSKHDLRTTVIVQWRFEAGLWCISMRTNGAVNVAELCAVYGGGGHPNAAGCKFRHAKFSNSLTWGVQFSHGRNQIFLELA